MQMYAVLVHAHNLIITDESGAEKVGGAYTWRYVEAADVDSAKSAAVQSLLETPAFRDEVRNRVDASRDVAVEEVVQVASSDRTRGTGVVFYIDTDEPTQ